MTVGKRAIARAWFERLFAPGYGCCDTCRRPWNRVDEHVVDYWWADNHSSSRGAFAQCESCWAASTWTERWAALYHTHGYRSEDWPLIEAAVDELARPEAADRRMFTPNSSPGSAQKGAPDGETEA